MPLAKIMYMVKLRGNQSNLFLPKYIWICFDSAKVFKPNIVGDFNIDVGASHLAEHL